MSEVSKASGAAKSTPTTKTTAKNTAKKQVNKPEVGKEMQPKKAAPLKEPPKPKPKQIIVTIGSGSSLLYLAGVHNTTVADIMKLNPEIKNADKIREGQQIKINSIDKKTMEAYETKLAAYENQQYEIRKAKEVQQRIELAKKKIQQAKKDGWEVDYKFSVNKDGYVIVTPKERKKLHEIRSDLGLPAGHLDAMNNLEGKYGKIPTIDLGDRYVETWDNVKTKDGDNFNVDPGAIRTSRTWTQFFKDLF